jgi:predicted nuclease with TOPRIM domain
MEMIKDQPIGSLLASYDALTDRLGELLKREHVHLKEGRSLEDTMDEKKALLEEITDLNAQLQNYGRDRASIGTVEKTRVEGLQNKLMLILKLDRAVEKQYLSISAQVRTRLKLDPIPSRVSQAYGKRS